MAEPPNEQNPIGVAMVWVSRITTIAAEMVLPGLGGVWLDQRYGTSYLALLGFALGLIVGVWHLLSVARESVPKMKLPVDDRPLGKSSLEERDDRPGNEHRDV